MDKIKAVIIDDELSARNVLSSLLKLFFPFVEVVAVAEDLSQGVEQIKEHQPDLIFLDVEMPNYAGYEIVRFFDSIDFHIIFVTAYNQYAINAFEINALDYLLKPIERSRLEQAIGKVLQKIKEKQSSADYSFLLDELKRKENQTIALSIKGSRHLINIHSIVAIYAQGAYSEIYLEDRKILVSKNIGTLAKELTDQECFFRTHKSWLVNKKHINSYQKGKQIVCLENDVEAKVSRTQKSEFEAWL